MSSVSTQLQYVQVENDRVMTRVLNGAVDSLRLTGRTVSIPGEEKHQIEQSETSLTTQQLAEILKNALSFNTLKIHWAYDVNVIELLPSLSNRALTELEVGGMCLGDEKGRELLKTVKTLEHLRSLNLGWNEFTAGIVPELVNNLAGHPSLRSLSVHMNAIGDDGVKGLSSLLATNPHLTCLSLSKTQMGDAGLEALTSALKTNSTLKRLQLDKNSFGGDAVRALLEVVSQHASMLDLHLDQAQVPENIDQLGLKVTDLGDTFEGGRVCSISTQRCMEKWEEKRRKHLAEKTSSET